MKTRSIALAGLAAFLGTTTAFGAIAQGAAPIAPTVPGRMRGAPKGEKHPELRKALRILERAQDALQHAAHDFAGHREKALDHTQQAIKEVQAALTSDTK